MTEPADGVVLSYPAEFSTWSRSTVEDRPFRAYLRRAHDTATPGEGWSEFVGVDCCGSALDVSLRVERVEGDTVVTGRAEFAFTTRTARGLDGGWRVQGESGPPAGSR